jgi:hypothetical protein
MRLPRYARLIAVAVLVILLGGYSAFWFVVAGQIENGIGEWAESLRPHNVDLSWRTIRVGGFPLVFRAELAEALLRDPALTPPAEIRVPRLEASAHPWNFRNWRLAAPAGLTATLGPPEKPAGTLSAREATGTVATSSDDGAAIRVRLDEMAVDAATMRVAARQVDLALSLPQHPPQTAGERAIAVALALREVTVPAVPAPLRNPLDEVSLAAVVMAPVPAAPPREAAAAWRDAGGTVELERVALRWGTLAVSGSGTMALDAELQPLGSFSAAIEGYDELISALVASGRLRARDAGLAQMALGFLAKPGPNRRPQISAPLTIQDGQMLLGPVKLGPAPRIPW